MGRKGVQLLKILASELNPSDKLVLNQFLVSPASGANMLESERNPREPNGPSPRPRPAQSLGPACFSSHKRALGPTHQASPHT